MDKAHFTSYKEYRDICTGANIDRRPVAVIMAELDEVEARLAEKSEVS